MTTRHFGIMVNSRDPEFDGCWLSANMPTTRETYQALYWTDRESAARYLYSRFGGDPNMHINLTIEEIVY